MNKVIPLLAILLWFCTACGEKKSTLVISDRLYPLILWEMEWSGQLIRMVTLPKPNGDT